MNTYDIGRSLECLGFALGELSCGGNFADVVEGFRLFKRLTA